MLLPLGKDQQAGALLFFGHVSKFHLMYIYLELNFNASILGKKLSRRHFKIFFLFFPENRS